MRRFPRRARVGADCGALCSGFTRAPADESGKGRAFAKACWRKLGQSELEDLSDGVDWLVAQGTWT